MKLSKKVLAAAIAAGAAFSAIPAQATSPLMIRVGVHNADPKSDNGSLAGGTLDVSVDSQVSPTINIEWYFTPNLALDILGALPFKHDIEVSAGGETVLTGSTKHLPPTVSLQYHLKPDGRIDPYLGLGINYTMFWEDKLDNTDTALELDDSWGLAAQLGVDFALDNARQWVMGVDLRWMDIDTDAKVGGADAGTVEIDPIAYGVNLGYRF